MANNSRELDQEDNQAWRALLRAHSSLTAGVDRELTTTHQMPLADFDVLMQLSESPDRSLRMTELAKTVLLSPSGLTRRLDGLVKAGLVERRPCPSDGRGLLAVLTDKGSEAVRRIEPTHVKALRAHFVDCVSKPQLRELVSILEHIASRNEAGLVCEPSGTNADDNSSERQPAAV